LDDQTQRREGREEPSAQVEALARTIVDAGLKVHRALGPGLGKRGLQVRRQGGLPNVYDGVALDAGYRLDLAVKDQIIGKSKLSRRFRASMRRKF
jgi:iron complex transport system substrate-binding protein